MRPVRRIVQTLAAPGEAIDRRVDAVELRLDLYPGLDVAAFLESCPKPVVATVRRVREGGRWEGAEVARGRLLHTARRAAWVDLELDAAPELAPSGPRRIVSFHDLEGLPFDLDGLFERCLLAGGDLVKIAATPADATEAFCLLDLPTAGLGMGAAGEFTRVLAPWTYCCRRPLAPGMPTPEALLDLYGAPRLGLRPALFGVAGDPIAHSRSPQLHNPRLIRDGYDAVYLRFQVARLHEFWPVFLAHGGRGLSVTAPLKEQAAALASRPSQAVAACGAANTLLADGSAHNTDYRAFLDLLPDGGGEALVMGAGGAARAALLALREKGYSPRVWNRSPERARGLGAPLAPRLERAPVVINTTPLDPPAAPFVMDLRYGPGIRPPPAGVGGLAFLEAQARYQYALFTGHGFD